MDNKLQQKFALVQQMKKEKERKEASRVKDHRSVDIFALAGVNLPTTALAQSRHDKDKDKDRDSRHGPPGKRPRVQKTVGSTATSTGGPLSPSSSSSNSVTSPRRENEETITNGTISTTTTITTTTTTTAAAAVARTETGTEKKLKRSSMAVRNATAASQMHVHKETGDSSEKMDNSTYVGRGRNPSVSSMGSPPYTATSSHHTSDNNHATTATPPTPIPSPRTDPSVQSDNLTYNRPVDSQAGGRRWSASTDNREEIVRTGHGQPLRSTRHQSPDTMSDHHSSSTRMDPLTDQSGSQESRKRRMDGHADFERRPGDYNSHRPRFRSNSRSRSHSPGRQGSFRSHSRSVSPYRDQGPDVYKRRDSARDFEQDDYTHHDQRSSIRRHQDLPSLFKKIRIEGLVDSTSVTALLAAFEPYGEIEEANLVEGKNTAFVTYTRLDAAQRALEMMNGSTLEGSLVRVFREECPMYYQRGSGSEAGTLSPLPARDGTRRPSLATSTSSASSQGLTTPEAPTTMTTTRSIHQLPPRPRSPKLPPKPVAAVYPPVGADPRAAVAQARGRSRQILSYGDL